MSEIQIASKSLLPIFLHDLQELKGGGKYSICKGDHTVAKHQKPKLEHSIHDDILVLA